MNRHLKAAMLACCLAGVFHAPAAEPAPAKFLFLVEASTVTANRSELTALAVADLIERGLGGRMRAGDVFTIVPFNEQLDPSGYARKVWEPGRSRHISNLAFLYLQKYKFEKKTRPERVISLINGVLLTERDVAVYLVASGEFPLQDTPFDTAINNIYRDHQVQWQSNKAIVVTALIGEKGRFTEWAVGEALPPAPVRLLAQGGLPKPALPPTTNLVVQPTAATNLPPVVPKATNQTAAINTNGTATIPPKPPTNHITVAPPKVVPPATNRSVVVPPIPPKVTNEVAIAPPKATNVVVITVTSAPPVEVKPAPLPPVPVVNQATSAVPPILAVAANPSPASNLVAAPPLPAPTNRAPIVQPIMAVGPVAKGKPVGLLLAGLAFLVAAIWLGLVWMRRTRPAPAASLITQSFEKDRPRRPPS